MSEADVDQLVQDLIMINQKKKRIQETLAFTQKAHKTFLMRQRQNRIRVLMGSVSGLAALVLLSLVVFPSLVSLNGPAQYTLLYTKFDSEVATRGMGQKDQIGEIASYYANGQYATALIKADSLLNFQPLNTELLFFKGLTEIELNQLDNSVSLLTKVIPQGGTFEVYSRWYLALIYLKQNNFAACREQLVSLKKMEDKPYKKQVDQLYRKLRFRKTP